MRLAPLSHVGRVAWETVAFTSRMVAVATGTFGRGHVHVVPRVELTVKRNMANNQSIGASPNSQSAVESIGGQSLGGGGSLRLLMALAISPDTTAAIWNPGVTALKAKIGVLRQTELDFEWQLMIWSLPLVNRIKGVDTILFGKIYPDPASVEDGSLTAPPADRDVRLVVGPSASITIGLNGDDPAPTPDAWIRAWDNALAASGASRFESIHVDLEVSGLLEGGVAALDFQNRFIDAIRQATDRYGVNVSVNQHQRVPPQVDGNWFQWWGSEGGSIDERLLN